MAANSDFEDVSNLTIVLANYVIALSEIFPILESIEKEAIILAKFIIFLSKQQFVRG